AGLIVAIVPLLITVLDFRGYILAQLVPENRDNFMVPADRLRIGHRCVCTGQLERVGAGGNRGVAQRKTIHVSLGSGQRVVGIEVGFLVDMCIEAYREDMYPVARSACPVVVCAVATLG